MQEQAVDNRVFRTYPRCLWFLILSYSMVIVMANWFDPRLIQLFGITTDAGTLIFPFTFLLSDLITEVYGYKHARRAIWCGFLFNAIFILYGQIVIHLPSPSYETLNSQFDLLLKADTRIIFASVISYVCAEPLNSVIMAQMKIWTQGRYMGLRFMTSTLIAAGVDSTIFGTLAFYGLMSNYNLAMLILGMWAIKVGIEFIGLPISLRIARKFKQIEQLDVYDEKTKFKVFSLETNYQQDANHYRG